MSKKDFLKLDIVSKYVLGICIIGGISAAMSAIQIPFLLTGMSSNTITIVSSAILLAAGLLLIAAKNMPAACALLLCAVINTIINTITARSFSGWLNVVLGIAAVILAYIVEKKWNDFEETAEIPESAYKGVSGGKKKNGKGSSVKESRYGRVSEPVYTPAPSIDPAAIASYQPNKNLTTVLASPDDPAPYGPSGAAAGQAAEPASPVPAAMPAQYQETAPAPSVAPAAEPAQYQETAPAPSVAPEISERPIEKHQPDTDGDTKRFDTSDEDTVEAEIVAEDPEIVAEEAEIVVEDPEIVAEDAEIVVEDLEIVAEDTEKRAGRILYGYKIVKEGLYGYHYFDGDEIVCTIEGVNASNTPVSIQGSGEHWYCINDWGIRVAPGQRKYIINYADDMTNGIFEYRERDHYIMNYKADTVDAVTDGDVTYFTSEGTEIAMLKTERGTFDRQGKDGYSYAEEFRVELIISEEAGVIRNLIMAFPLLYFG